MSPYQTKIKELSPASDPRHVEGYMRLAHGTLDQLSHSNSARKSLWRLLASQKAASTRPRSSHNPTGCSPSTLHPTFALFLPKHNSDCWLPNIMRLTPMILFEFAFSLPDTAVESTKRNATARSCCQIKCDCAPYRARLACQCVASQFEIGLRSPGAVIR